MASCRAYRRCHRADLNLMHKKQKRTIYTDLARLQAWWDRQPRWWRYTFWVAVALTAAYVWGVIDDRPLIITERPD